MATTKDRRRIAEDIVMADRRPLSSSQISSRMKGKRGRGAWEPSPTRVGNLLRLSKKISVKRDKATGVNLYSTAKKCVLCDKRVKTTDSAFCNECNKRVE